MRAARRSRNRPAEGAGRSGRSNARRYPCASEKPERTKKRSTPQNAWCRTVRIQGASAAGAARPTSTSTKGMKRSPRCCVKTARMATPRSASSCGSTRPPLGVGRPNNASPLPGLERDLAVGEATRVPVGVGEPLAGLLPAHVELLQGAVDLVLALHAEARRRQLVRGHAGIAPQAGAGELDAIGGGVGLERLLLVVG